MQLPNKLYSYNNSTLSLIPLVLDEIKNGPVEVKVLYERIKPSLKDSTDFISVMDCLYALRAADLNDEGGVFIRLGNINSFQMTIFIPAIRASIHLVRHTP